MIMEPRVPMYISVWLEHGCFEDTRGIWLPLPATKKEFHAALEAIGVSEYSSIYITSYNVRIPGINRNMLLEAPLGRVNFFASRLMALNDEQLVKLAAIIDSDRYFVDLEQFIDYTYSQESYTLIPGVRNAADLGRLYLDGADFASVPGYMKKCIDPYALGIGVAEERDGQFTALGYLTSDNGWSVAPKARKIPAALNLTGIKGEDLYGIDYYVRQITDEWNVDDGAEDEL